MDGIRIESCEKRIEVNDNGDYIVLNFGDSSFPDRFFSMVDNFNDRAKQTSEKAEALKEKYKPESEDLTRAAASLYREFHESIMCEVDGLFGAQTCKKVFGDIVPDISLFDDFFTQLQPFFQEYSNERAKRMSKYSAQRTGNV